MRNENCTDTEKEQNVVTLILNLMRYLIQNSDIMQDRMQRNNGVQLLSFLLQRLPRHFIDVHMLHMCQEYVSEARSLANKSLLNTIYEHIIFEFRIWNKADYEIRIGHIQYISTIIKDDKRSFRRKYGIQFFLDVIKTYFVRYPPPPPPQSQQQQQADDSSSSSGASSNTTTGGQQQQQATGCGGGSQAPMNEDDLRNLRNSFFGLIKFYAQKDIRPRELDAMLSFLANTRNPMFQADLLDMLIALLEAPANAANDQLFLLMFEPHMADGLYSLVVQPDISERVQRKLLKVIKILLKTKKVYDKNKTRMRLDECGTYAGLVGKLNAEYAARNQRHPRASVVGYSAVAAAASANTSDMSLPPTQLVNVLNELFVIDLLENCLLDDTAPNCYENMWSILSLLSPLNTSEFNMDMRSLIRMRLKACNLITGLFL